MTEGDRFFKDPNGKGYVVSESKAKDWLSRNPGMIEYAKMDFDGTQRYVPLPQLPTTLRDFPNATLAEGYSSELDKIYRGLTGTREYPQPSSYKAPTEDKSYLMGGSTGVAPTPPNQNSFGQYASGFGKEARSMGTEAATWIWDKMSGISPYGDVGQDEVTSDLKKKAEEYAAKPTDNYYELMGRKSFIPASLVGLTIAGVATGGSAWSALPAATSELFTLGMVGQAGYQGMKTYEDIMKQEGKEPDPDVADAVGMASALITYGSFKIAFNRFLPKNTEAVGLSTGKSLGKYYGENPQDAFNFVELLRKSKPDLYNWLKNKLITYGVSAAQAGTAMAAMDAGNRALVDTYTSDDKKYETQLQDYLKGAGKQFLNGIELGVMLHGTKELAGRGKLAWQESTRFGSGKVNVARDNNGKIYRLFDFAPNDQVFSGLDVYGNTVNVKRSDVKSLYTFSKDQFKHFVKDGTPNEINRDALINSADTRVSQITDRLRYEGGETVVGLVDPNNPTAERYLVGEQNGQPVIAENLNGQFTFRNASPEELSYFNQVPQDYNTFHKSKVKQEIDLANEKFRDLSPEEQAVNDKYENIKAEKENTRHRDGNHYTGNMGTEENPIPVEIKNDFVDTDGSHIAVVVGKDGTTSTVPYESIRNIVGVSHEDLLNKIESQKQVEIDAVNQQKQAQEQANQNVMQGKHQFGFEQGEEVTFDGKKARVSDISNPDFINIDLLDKNGDVLQTLPIDEMRAALLKRAEITDEKAATAEKSISLTHDESGNVTGITAKIPGKQFSYQVTTNEDGTRTITDPSKPFTSQKSAQGAINLLKPQFPNLTFSAVQVADSEDDFAQGYWVVKTTKKNVPDKVTKTKEKVTSKEDKQQELNPVVEENAPTVAKNATTEPTNVPTGHPTLHPTNNVDNNDITTKNHNIGENTPTEEKLQIVDTFIKSLGRSLSSGEITKREYDAAYQNLMNQYQHTKRSLSKKEILELIDKYENTYTTPNGHVLKGGLLSYYKDRFGEDSNEYKDILKRYELLKSGEDVFVTEYAPMGLIIGDKNNRLYDSFVFPIAQGMRDNQQVDYNGTTLKQAEDRKKERIKTAKNTTTNEQNTQNESAVPKAEVQPQRKDAPEGKLEQKAVVGDKGRELTPKEEAKNSDKNTDSVSKWEQRLAKAQSKLDEVKNDERANNLNFVGGGNLSKSASKYRNSHREKFGRVYDEVALLKRAVKIARGEPFTLRDINEAKLSIVPEQPDDWVSVELPLLRAAEIVRESFNGKYKSILNSDILLDYETINKIVWKVSPENKIEQAYVKDNTPPMRGESQHTSGVFSPTVTPKEKQRSPEDNVHETGTEKKSEQTPQVPAPKQESNLRNTTKTVEERKSKDLQKAPENGTERKKEPWEMTRGEYIDYYLRQAYINEYGSLDGYDVWRKSNLSTKEVNAAAINADDSHEDIIKQALSEGKPVPEEVLNDYPELKPSNKPSVKPSKTETNGQVQAEGQTKTEKVTPVEQEQPTMASTSKSPVTGSPEPVSPAVSQSVAGNGVKFAGQALKKGGWKEPKFVKEAKAIQPGTVYEETLLYFIEGGRINKDALKSIFGGKHGGDEKSIEGERKARISYYSPKGRSVNQIAHYLWQSSELLNSQGDPMYETSDYREAIEQIVISFNSPLSMAKELLKGRNNDIQFDDSDERAAYEYMRDWKNDIEMMDDYYDWLITNGNEISENEINSLFSQEQQLSDEKTNDKTRVSGQDIAEGSRGSQENGQTGNRNTERSSGENAPENGKEIASQPETIQSLQEKLQQGKISRKEYDTQVEALRHPKTESPKFAGEVLAKDNLQTVLGKYGWTSTVNDKGEIQLINRNKKEVATIKQSGASYTIYDNSGNKLLSGNKSLSDAVEKVIRDYFYGVDGTAKEPETPYNKTEVPLVSEETKTQVKVGNEWYARTILKNGENLHVGTVASDLLKAPIIRHDGRLFINPDYITDSQWNQLNNRLQQLGFTLRKASEWESYFRSIPTGEVFVDDHKAAFEKVFSKELESVSGEDLTKKADKLNKAAKKYFGTTNNFNEVGYITTDGSMLDFSGRIWGGSGGRRDMDHREISSLDEQGVETDMVDFMSVGNIRMQPQSGGFDITMPPNAKQVPTLKNYINHFEGNVYVDFSNPGSYGRKNYVEYTNAKADRIINDIRRYYNEGIILPTNPLREPETPYTKSNVSPIGFYSTVERSLSNITQDKGRPEQFKAMLLNNGAKQAELDWMGWDSQFANQESVTKSDIQKWIDENRIEVKEVVNSDYQRNRDDVAQELYNKYYDDLGDSEQEDVRIQLDRELKPKTKFSQYQLPGGEKYKELLLTMPETENIPKVISYSDAENIIKNGGQVHQNGSNSVISTINQLEQYPLDEEFRTEIGLVRGDTFKSSHFDEPNIVAHVRFNERTDTDGKRVLFVEEIQSDWAQKGKKEGFKGNDIPLIPLLKPQEIEITQSQYQYHTVIDGKKYDVGKGTVPNEGAAKEYFANWLNKDIKHKNDTIEAKNKYAIPDMPFKKTDQWLNLAIRRMIRYAAENGFDRIAWTNGEIQAERYDLSKHLNSIDWGKNYDGTYDVQGNLIKGGYYTKKKLDANGIAEHFGKEIADKITSSTEEEGLIEGVDLKVGGEGMKSFYDQIVPSLANKLGKPFGSKVEETELPGIGKVQSLPVTDKMRQTALEGLPLFEPSSPYYQGELNLSFGSETKQKENVQSLIKNLESKKYPKVKQRTVIDKFKENFECPVIGLTIQSPVDVADITTAIRSPYIEKQLIIFGKDGVGVGSTVATCNSMGYVSFPSPDKVAELADKYGANEIWYAHNHPSGNYAVSEADVFVTLTHQYYYETYRPDLKLKGHIVTDHEKFSVIPADTKIEPTGTGYFDNLAKNMVSSVPAMDFNGDVPQLFSDRESLGTSNQTSKVTSIAKDLFVNNKLDGAVIFLTPNLQVTAFEPMPRNMTESDVVAKVKELMDKNIGYNYIITHTGWFAPKMTYPAGWLDTIDTETGYSQDTKHEQRQMNAHEVMSEPENIPDTIKVDGVSRPTRNSKGQVIHPTVKGIENFWRWFNGSVVVDEQGRPLVVYHATQSDFEIFLKEKQGTSVDFGTLGNGFYFTSDLENVNNYANNINTNTGKKGGESIIPVYVKLINPKEVVSAFEVSGNNKIESEKYTEKQKLKGYDGVLANLYAFNNDLLKWIVAYESTQIKSATGNNGNFSDSPSIVESPNVNYQRNTKFAGSLLSPKTDPIPEISNPQAEKAFKDSSGLHGETFKNKLLRWADEFESFFHHYKHIKESDFPETYNKLRMFEEIPKYVKSESVVMIKDILDPIYKDKNAFMAFQRHIILSDLAGDIKSGLYKGKELPFEFKSEAEVTKYLADLNAYINLHPNIKKALDNRRAAMNDIRKKLVGFGLLPEEVLKREDYFHRQVLDYMTLATKTSSGDLRTHTKGWQKKRAGSSLNYNTNYIESEFEVLAQSLQQIETKKMLNEIGVIENIAYGLKSLAEKKGVSVQSLIPEGYTKWTPAYKSLAWHGATFHEKVLAKAIKTPEELDMLSEIANQADDRYWIIRKSLAEQLDGMIDKRDDVILDRATKKAMSWWKQYILFNPYRVSKYMLNNAIGDMDIVLAHKPSILLPKYMTPATSEAFNYFRNHKASKDIELCLKHGVISSSITIQEIPDINNEIAYTGLLGGGNILSKYWKSMRDANAFREALLRVGAYKYFKEKLDAGVKVYGVSMPKAIDAIKTNEEKAAKLSRELLGDYGNLSQFGMWMREHIYPFWSWVEINTPRYFKLFRNLKYEQEKEGSKAKLAIGGVGKLALKVFRKLFTANLLYALVMLYNRLMFPDEYDELRKNKDRNPKLILGRDDDGNIRTIRVNGALADALSFLDFEDLPDDIMDVRNGKSTFAKKAKESRDAFVNKLAQGALPYGKNIAQVISGQEFYPDILNPRPSRDRWETSLKMFSLDKVYRYLTKKPLRKFGREMSSVLVYNIDPGEAAYYTMRQKASDFLEENGESGGMFKFSEQANYLYYYKQSLKFGNEKLANYWYEKYAALYDHDTEKVAKNIQRSINYGRPENTIQKKALRQQWLDSLDSDDLEMLTIANEWYDKTYTNGN